MSRRFGLDGWAVGVHLFVTIALAAALGEGAGRDAGIAIPLTFAVSGVIFEWRRRRALAQSTPEGLTTGEVQLERIAELEARMAEMEVLHGRMVELEERLDFSERLLAQGRMLEAPGLETPR